MSKWRKEVKVLNCGCKIGGQKGAWFYDYICENHLSEVQVDGKFNYEKSLEFTNRLNRMMGSMTLLKTIMINDAIIDIWRDKDGTIILGGVGWIEYYDYMEDSRDG